ncbi:DUF6064 family protein [Skermanella mucosa]|uniref:DUF6064 family protein n=1 Tax=Skermanella mucosa TaxID=1789672 RepID=UPI00192B95F7|nr:DUF6064 family protein [Skermanella mucosa]UEM20746.1 DUF6064 family protein [Skermanella mucosa]
MSEWWTYTLSDFLLFSSRTYHRLFELHNADLWPAHLAALAVGVAILALAARGGPARGRIAAALLAACWAWVAWSFLYTRYATINWAATWFAGLFLAQAALLVLAGTLGGKLDLAAGRPWRLGLFAFALAAQPLAGVLAGRDWSQVEVFAMTPDPTAVGTLGIVALASGPWRWVLMVLPVLWCMVSGATLWTMGASDALVPPLAAMVALVIAARGNGDHDTQP